MRKHVSFFLCSLFVIGTLYAAPQKSARNASVEASPPHHIWSAGGPLTPPSSDAPAAIGLRFIASVASELALPEADLPSVYLVKEYRSPQNGIIHLIYRQQYDGFDVHGSDFTVNLSSNGEVLNAGGALYARPQSAPPSVSTAGKLANAAVRAVNPAAAEGSYLAGPSAGRKDARTRKFVRGGFADAIEGTPVWYPAGKQLRAGWSFFQPDASGELFYRTLVDAEKEAVVKNTRLAAYQNPQTPPPPRGLVYLDSPQPDTKLGTLTLTRPYAERTLVSFAGDPQASPRGWVDGTETAGNNTITGQNVTGARTLTPITAKSPTRDFSFPLQLGPDAPNPTNYADAATTNLFYWINRTHDYFWHIGFDEPAGNYQVDNFGRGGVGGDPIYAYSQFGIARPGTPLLDNASFFHLLSEEDGFPGYVRMYLAGDRLNNIFTDGSFDAGVIIHEYTHGVSNRLARGVYETYQGRAMGEAWSDYFALEMLHPEGLSPALSYVVGEYAFQAIGAGIRTRPYSTDMNVNALTFANYGRVLDIGLEEHIDGEIWMEALWEARANFITLYGETEGRKRMQMNVIEGMKLQPPQAGMIEARDAIILANRANYNGGGEQRLWEAFAKRGIGIVAQSRNGDSMYVVPSFAAPSNTAVLRFHTDSYVPGETVRVTLYDANNTSPTALVQLTSSSGDLEHVTLRRRGTAYEGSIVSGNDGFVGHRDEFVDIIPGDFISAYYMDRDTGGGSAQLIQTTVAVQPEYTFTPQVAGPHFVSGTERTLFAPSSTRRLSLDTVKVNLPFEFRFFDRTYRSMFVSVNGVITFGVPNPTFCNDGPSVASVPAIAPMWTELVYGGTAQANENVYYSSHADSVTVRWAAETAYSGEPVNFSAVLYSDGRILFQYGAGNNNVVNTAAIGCSTNTPVVGISPGRDSYELRYGGYDELSFFDGFPSVLIEPPFNPQSDPVVRLELPEMNGSYSGVLTVRGIASDVASRVTRLDLIIDGVSRGMIQPQAGANATCTAERLRNCFGFVRQVDLSAFDLKPGTHTLQVRATNARGASWAFPEQPVTFNFEGGQGRTPVVVVETPEEGATLTATTPVRGYAYAADLRIAAVVVLIDGVNYGTATYGVRRDDVCNTMTPRAPNCPGVGFQFSLNTLNGAVQLPNGKHSMQIRVTDESGRFTTSPEKPINITVENAANPGPVGRILTPAANATLTGIVKITGWAYDPNGTVAAVDFFVGNRIIGTLRYGVESPEACATLPDVTACPNIGFEGDFNTTLVPNGQHLFGVRIRDNNGRATILPVPSDSGMPVFISN